MHLILLSRRSDEPDKFDDDFNESESEEDDDGKEETVLRKNERAAKVCWCSSWPG